MIPLIQTPWEPNVWQRELAGAYRTPRDLCEYLGLTNALALDPAQIGEFSLLVPRGFAARMVRGDAQDPLLRQVLPSMHEHEAMATFVADPLQEAGQFSMAPGVIHKYHGRALIIATAGCAVHCRYCFRRHFPYAEHRPRQIEDALNYIKQDSSIAEVILSGGDPLLLNDAALASLIRDIAAIDHVRRLRVHSRLPIVLPERITAALLNTFESTRLQTVLVAHANHVNELDQNTRRAFGYLKASGVTLLNQAVLLAGVNNRADAQVDLCERLFNQGVLPYYLHMPDRVAGTHHFQVSRTVAAAIYREMQARLPGYLLPRLVQEVPGEAAKKLVQI